MKTILNLIITTFGVLFILSACGGGAAPTITIGVVNQTCSTNAFSPDCDDGGQIERTDAITDCAEKGECDDNIPDSVQTCLTDLFGDDCDAVAETIASRTSVTVAQLQKTFCEANKGDENCPEPTPDTNPDPNPDPTTEPTLVEVCTDDPFNSRCLTEYNGARETACRANNTPACADTITRFCETEATPANGNTLNSLCGAVKYNEPREVACRTGSHDLLCGATITRFCETEAVGSPANVFNPLCATYENAREIACRTGNYDSLCGDTITRFCETEAVATPANVFNSLCGAVKYNEPREVACRTGSHDSLCPATIMRYCEVDAANNPDNTFNPLCNDNQIAMGVRDAFCKDTGNNNANPFSMRCVENAEGLTARNNYCGVMATDATANAFEMRCVDDAKGLEVRNAYCVIGGDDLATGNAFKPECVHSPAGNAIVLASSECMDTTVVSYPLGVAVLSRDCLTTVERICRAGVASFDTRCESVTTERCGEALGWLYEPLCAGGEYQARRETACLMEERPDTLLNGCRDTVYLRLCGAGAENPFDTGAGATGMINCLALENNARRHGVQDYTGFRQRVCGNSRPDAGSKFETECNSLIVGLCTANPFDETAGAADYNCYMDGAFDTRRDTHRITCTTGTTSATDPNCFDLAVLEPCTRDPLREECDPEEFKDARTARTSYCEGVTSGTDSAPNLLCGAYRAPFCDIGADGETGPLFNPIAKICPNDAANLPVRVAYCTIGNNWNDETIRAGCMNANTTFGRCIENPFKTVSSTDSRSICTTNPPQFGLAALANRVKFCSGDVAEADLNLCTFKESSDHKTTQDMLCLSSGRYANPFVNLCAGVANDELRATFLDRCQNDIPALNGATSCAFVMSCIAEPYGEDCVYHRPYFASRWAIVEACAALDEGEYDATCTEDIRTNIQQACLVDPYAEGCKDNRDYTSRRTARVDECKGYGSSKSIRDGGGANETRCRVAIDDFCTGDKLFTTDGVECFTDAEYAKDDYLTDRNMHLAECQKAASARAPRTVCTEVSAHICVSAESEYTNPFLPVCDEDGRSSLVPRQELILRCQPLNTATRAEMGNEGCEIAKAKMILTNCDDNPFHADCNDYISRGQAYFEERTKRVMACGEASETGARCDGTQARLCVSDTAEAAPLSPACDNLADIATIRNDFLEDCADGSSVLNCAADFAMTVKTACDADPYVTAVSTADGSMVSCVEFDSYDLARETRLAACETDRSNNVCTGTINIICLGDGEDVNPFNTALCGHLASDVLATPKRNFCQIRANVDNDECDGEGKALTRPTTASVLAERDTELGATPTAGMGQTNEFLKGTDDGLNTAGFLQANGDDAEVITINMATAEYDGEPLGGDSADGIAFFVGHAPDNSFRVEYYAGILAGADLGAALTHVADTKVNWYGAINWAIAIRGGKGFAYHDQTAIGTTTRDFVLEIDLDAREFRSFFQRTGTTFNDGAQGFLLTGDYDATTGVIIEGKVLFGVKSGDEILRNGESGATYHFEGPLIGIIGQEGALGVFYAQRSNDGQGDALGGGFVARPLRPDFFSWTLFAVDPAEAPLTIRSIADAGDGATSFIRGGTEALDVGAGGVTYTLTLADDYSKADSLDARFGGNIVTLGGDAVDGISFALDGDRLYSGLLAGTNLGAPTASASYQGRIGILIRKDGDVIYDVDNEFTLNANLGLGTFNNGSATFSNGIFQISGGKFNQFGLISGTVTLGGSTGTLSGLIGEDGVVGTFISTVHTDGAFAGGFVARVIGLNGLTSAAPRDRITEIWRVHAVTDDGTALDVLEDSEAVDSDNPPTNFIVGGTGALELGNAQNIKQKTLKTMDDSFTSTRGDTVRFTGNSLHGVAFARAIVLSDAKWYAGLLSGTRLTSPVSHTAASAQWVGQFGLIRDGLNNDEPYIAPFVLNVDFKGRRIYTSSIRIPSSVLPSGVSGEFVFSGNYDGHGIIRGTVGYKNIATGGVETDFAGTLTGLIGVDIGRAETAIGAFVSDSGTGAYAGGFVAREVAGVTITEKVAYGDWVHSFGTPPPDRLDTVTRSNQFLAGERDRLNEMGANNPQGHTIFIGNDEGSFDGVRLDLDRVDGMSYFSTTIDGTDYFYAGIFSDADLGEPVGLMFDGQPTGKWNGRFGYRAPRGSSTDFTLEINFANSSIEAFVAGKDGNHFHLNGSYDENGAIINGTVDYGLFTAGTRTPTATRTPNGTLTGIIGQQGAIGAFISHATGGTGYAGGFLATPTAQLDPLAVKYSDWVHSFATPPPIRVDTSARHPQFLGTVAGAIALDEMDAQEVINDRRGGITLADSFTDITFVGDAEDGVSFFWDQDSVVGYTGILAGTDLGAPFTQGDGPAKVTWEGWFQAIVREAERKFDLEIDFNNNGKKTIEAFVQQAGNVYYHLTGEFDANGVITGMVNYGTFSNVAMRTAMGDRAPNGHLTGLIGEDGAVGAFVSGTGTKDVIVKGTVFAGGFVASPNVADRADYIGWTGSFTTPLTDTMLATTARVSQFLATAPRATALDETEVGTIDAVNKGSLNLANATFKGAGLGGQAADGVSWFLDSTNNFGYAGILSSTDLGLPLMQTSGTAKWQGHIQATGGVSRDFILNINFDNNGEKTIDAFVFHNIMNTDGVFTDVTATNYYHLTGEFDDKGVITGEVNYGTFSTLASEGVEPVATDGRADNGILTGLIGVEGAVGTFISGTGDKNAIAASDPVVHYAGGFVATPTDALDDNVVNYDDWARSFITLPPNRVYQTGELTRTSQFVVGKTDRTNELGTRGVESDDTGTLNLADSFEEITFAGAAADGVNFFWDAQGTAGYAGILAGTNLGAPLTQGGGPAKLFWNGQFQEVVTRLNREFVLEIDFDNNNKIEAFVQQAGNTYFHLTGSFDAKGVITGKVNYGAFNAGTRVATGNPTARPDNGILTGLIGMEGAVGAFVAGTGTKDAIVRLPVDVFYTGGFVAHKDATSTGNNVKFNDWVRSFNTAPLTAPSTTFTNQFLQGTDTTLTATAVGLGSATDGTGTITPTLLDLSTATYDNTNNDTDDATALGGDAKNGVGFFEGYDTTNGRYFYAGIFNGADLGAPLTAQTAAGVWHGQLQMVGTKAVNTDFTLEVTFGAVSGFPGSAGGVSAFIEQNPDPNYDYYLLTGTYDSNGVITGTVDFGGFTDGERATPTGDRVGGTLTGLIGQKGAIGAFHSTATGSDGYAGGFVACRYDTTANACQQ